jgi:hypothetical protein
MRLALPAIHPRFPFLARNQALQFASFADAIFCRRLTDGSKIEPHEKGGEHDFAAAGFPLDSDTDGIGCGARLWASGAHGCTSQWQQGKRRIDPGFLGRMASRVASLVRAAGIGSRPGDEQVAQERSEQLRPTGR